MVILAAPHTRGNPALKGLAPSAYQFANVGQLNKACDFIVSGDIHVVFELLSNVKLVSKFVPGAKKGSGGPKTISGQALTIEQRLSEAKHSNLSCKQLCLILCDTGAEPDLAIMTALDIACVQHSYVFFLAWSVEEAAQTLIGLDYATVAGTGGHLGIKAGTDSDSAGLPVLLHSLSSTVTGISQQDAVRLCNEHKGKTIGELLALEAHSIQGLPGMGPRKCGRVEAVFNTPFLGGDPSTSLASAPTQTASNTTATPFTTAVPPPVQQASLPEAEPHSSALAHALAKQDEEEDDTPGRQTQQAQTSMQALLSKLRAPQGDDDEDE